jgi:uncharacterized protein with von Willebrand factor type A (vWA) domain
MAEERSRRTSSISPVPCVLPAFRVGPGAVLDALAAVTAAGAGTREDFYWTLHAVFVKRHEHSLIFDQAFGIFFRKRAYLDKLIASLSPQAPARDQPAPKPGATRVEEALFAGLNERERREPEIEVDARLTMSDRELLQKKDFAQMTAAEIAAAKQAIKSLVLALDEVKTRRLSPDRRGHRIDMRRTLRASMKAGGAVIDLKYLGPRTKAPPIVALIDISGSMSQYTRLLLHFLHAVTDARSACAPSCSAHATNVARAQGARPRRGLAASRRASKLVRRHAHASSLHAFNKLWARRVLTQGAIVLLITDGLERDGGEHLPSRSTACTFLPAAHLAQSAAALSGFEARAKASVPCCPC